MINRVICSLCCLALTVGLASAKDMPRRTTTASNTVTTQQPPQSQRSSSGMTGLGFNTQLTDAGVTALSLRYWSGKNLGIEGLFGFTTGDNTTAFDLGLKILGALKTEPYTKVYGFGIIGIENRSKVNGVNDSDTGTTIGGGLGVEFFIPGLPNLSFGSEIGLLYNSTQKQIGTYAGWIPNVGMRYYF
jgi:hypothetical protein